MTETHHDHDRSGPVDTGCTGSRIAAMVRAISPWALLLIGATTIVFSEAVVEWLTVSGPWETVAAFVVALALVYGQIGLVYVLTERGS